MLDLKGFFVGGCLVNWVKVEKLSATLPLAWLPAATNAWWQLAMARSERVGLVSVQTTVTMMDTSRSQFLSTNPHWVKYRRVTAHRHREERLVVE